MISNARLKELKKEYIGEKKFNRIDKSKCNEIIELINSEQKSRVLKGKRLRRAIETALKWYSCISSDETEDTKDDLDMLNLALIAFKRYEK